MTTENIKKNRGGRPSFVPSDEQRYTVGVMVAGGFTEDQIAGALSISPKTLRKHFRDEIENGNVRFLTRVIDSLGRQALAGNVTAQIFILKTRAGWKETVVNEHTGKDGAPIEHRIADDAERFTSALAGLAARIGEAEGS